VSVCGPETLFAYITVPVFVRALTGQVEEGRWKPGRRQRLSGGNFKISITVYVEEQTVQNRKIQRKIIMAAISVLLASPAGAFDMGNMMNPSKWMGGNKDRYDDYDDYGGGPGYGYPGGPPGYGYGGPPGYGYGGPGYGGAPGYGYGGAPGYGPGPGYGYGGGYGGVPGYGAAPYAAPGAASNQAEITRLKERIRQLEGDLR
jgi:hypothetical protein